MEGRVVKSINGLFADEDGNIDFTGGGILNVGVTPIANGTPTEILYQKADGTLGQIPGFVYDEPTERLAYQNSDFRFNIGQTEIAPSIFVPTGSILDNDNFGFGIVDLTSLGPGVQAFIGSQNQRFSVDKFTGDNNIRAINNVNIHGGENLNMNFLGDFSADFIGDFYIKNRSTYIDNADALLNGAPIDSVYKTASGELRIVV